MKFSTRLLGIASLVMLVASPSFAQYKESPMSKAMVDAGTLKSVEQRLPEKPFVAVAKEVGIYGGTWRSALKGTNDTGWIRRTAYYDPLVKYTVGWDAVVPGIAESFEANDAATQFTFHLRKGHKWSDGTPFTAEDIVFAINEVINDTNFTGTRPSFLLGAKASALNPTTLVIDLPSPNGLFIEQMASVDGPQVTSMQKKYCSQFHPKYNSNADKLATDAGTAGWGEYMRLQCGVSRSLFADRPTLSAWKMVNNYDGINSLVKFERNPYYYKVDQKGNQLPYIDRLQMKQVEDANSIVLMGIAGELDFTNRHIDKVANKPVLFDNQKKGNYRLYNTVPADMNTAVIQLNLNHEDAGFRTLFQNKNFRIALSHAIDRQEVIDVVYAGQGEPFQAAPRPESPFYNEELAKQYTEFDPDKANKMLDALGLTERDGSGIRTMADGRPVTIQIIVSTDLGPQLDILELVTGHWAEVGIKLDVRKAERSRVYEVKDRNQHMLHVWKGDGGLGDAQLDPRYYLPMNTESAYAILWAKNWYDSDKANLVKPPPVVARQLDLYKQMFNSSSLEKRTELFKQILEITKSEFYTIGVSLPPMSFGVASNTMGNIPENQPHAWIYPNPGPMNTPVLFKKK